MAEASSQPLKCGRLLNAKDKIPWKRKTPNTPAKLLQTRHENELLSDHSQHIEPPEEVSLINTKISINYVRIREVLDRNQIIVDIKFAYKIALSITSSDDEI